MTERPKCSNENCTNPALMVVFGRYFCGECVAKWDKKTKEEQLNRMTEILECQ